MNAPFHHSFSFDPTHGYDVAALQGVRPPQAPKDFDAFWNHRRVRARAVDPNPRLTPSSLRHPDWIIFDLAFLSTDGVTIGGWLMHPRHGAIRRGLIVGHGYGGGDTPNLDFPVAETVVLFLCFRGLGRSPCPPVSPDPTWHVLHHIGDPDRYIIGGCVEDLWVAVTALEQLHGDVRGRIGYAGISFGGGIGALALAEEDRIDRGFLEVPTFGHRPLWLSLPSTGSAASVQAHANRHPGDVTKLALFDAACAASRIRVPMLVAAARFDPAVAPPCQFAIANALPSSKYNELVILDAGHFEYPDAAMQQADLATRIRRFFGTQLGPP